MPSQILKIETLIHSGQLVYSKLIRGFELRFRDYVDVENLLTTYNLFLYNSDYFGYFSRNIFETLRKYKTKGCCCLGVHLPNSFYSVFGNQGQLQGEQIFIANF